MINHGFRRMGERDEWELILLPSDMDILRRPGRLVAFDDAGVGDGGVKECDRAHVLTGCAG